MGEPKTKQERKNAMTIKITTGSGGGIGGIVFLGGALVAATVVSAFAFKRRTSRTEHQPKSSPENDVTVHLTPPPEAVPNDLEMMMKSSKDHHSQTIKGLTFLLPADSSLPFLPKNSRISIDAAPETGVTRIDPAQVPILDNEKAKLEVNDAGYQEMVLSEIHEESNPLFDESGITITKEEKLISVAETSSLECGSNKNVGNSVASDQQTICSDSLIPESNGFYSYGGKSGLSLPLVDTSLHSEPVSTNEDENSSEGVELLVEEDYEVKTLLPLLDSPLLSESENTNEEKLSKENSPVSVEAVELLDEEEFKGKSSLPLLNSALVFGSESMNKDEFLTEAIPAFAEVVGLELENYEVKSSLPLLDSAEAESTNIGNFSMENPPVADRDLKLLEEDSEENNAVSGYKDQNVAEKEPDVCDAIVQAMVQEDVVHEIPQEDQITGNKEILENHDEENFDSEPLVEANEVKKEGETFDVVCDSSGVEERKLEVRLIGKELEVIDAEENGNEIVGVDQIIAEVNEEVKSFKKGEKDDNFGETNVDERERTSMEALLDQVAEEEEEQRVELSEDKETVSNSVQDELQPDGLGMRPLDLSEVAIEVVCLDPIKVADKADMRLTEEEETDEDNDVQGDTITTKCEDEPTELAVADEVIESLEDGEKEESDEVYGDIIEVESMEETADVDELVKSLDENDEKDNGSRSLEEFSEPMVVGGMVLDQVAEEEEEQRVELSEDKETVSNSVQDELQPDGLGMRPLDLSEVAIEVVCLDPIKVEDKADMRLTEEEETDEDNDVQGDNITTKCEDEPTELAVADEVIESLEDGEKEESDEVYGDIIEVESLEETADVDELVKSLDENDEKDNGSRSLEEFSEPMVDGGMVLDQVAEEEEEQRVELSEDKETVSNSVQDELQSDGLGMRPLDLSEVAIEVVCLDPIKVEDKADMRLTEEEETDEGNDVQGDTITTKCEDEPTELAVADEVIESLEDGEKEGSDEVYGDIIEVESMEETADVDELVKSLDEKDNGSRSLEEFSELMVDGGMVLDSGKVPLSIEDEYPQIQPTEEEKTPQVELSDEEDSDGDEESEDDNEESSEGTEDLSTESNYDAVWPAESIQDLSFKLNKMKTNYQETKEESDNDNDDDEVETISSYMREVENQRTMEPWKAKSWAWAMLAMLWCFCHSYLDLPYVKVSLVALVIFIAVLFGFPNPFGFPNRALANKHK